MKVQRLPFLVAFPIPRLGRRKNQKLPRAKQAKAVRMALEALEKMFGGATEMRAVGITQMIDGQVLLDHGQRVVVSGTTRKRFLKSIRRIKLLAAKLGASLDQEAVAVLAYPSDSFIVFLEPRGESG